MAYNETHMLLAAHGALPSGEVWSCGFRTVGAPGYTPTQDGLEAAALSAANAWRVFQNTASNGWATGVTLDGVTARAINTAGVTTVLAERSPTAAAGAGTTLILPNQCAVVATLITTKPGRTGKGRIYLPLLGGGVGSGGRMSSTFCTTIANGVKTIITSINTGLASAFPGAGATIVVGVQSQKIVGGGGQPAVTGVRVGDIVDTQRRRRDSIAEAYISVTV